MAKRISIIMQVVRKSHNGLLEITIEGYYQIGEATTKSNRYKTNIKQQPL